MRWTSAVVAALVLTPFFISFSTEKADRVEKPNPFTDEDFDVLVAELVVNNPVPANPTGNVNPPTDAKPPPASASPSNPFDQLYKRKLEWGTREGDAPLPSGRPDPSTVDEAGGILTSDRRKKRVPLMIPLIDDKDFAPPKQEAEQTWDIVIGIAAIDTEVSRQMRNFQRESWIRYASVGKTVLVKYLLARHPSTGYGISDGLRAESRKHNDVLFFDLKEGEWDRNKGGKSWEVEVGMARKSYAWYCYVADTYKTRFVMKSDVDVFLRIEMLRNELLSLPFTNRVYYGRIMFKRVWKKIKFPYSGGMSITMSYDLVDWIRDSRFAENTVDYEDLMVGRWFFQARINLNVVQDCRHHDLYHGGNVQKPTDASICLHHVKEEQDYTANYKKYPDTSLPTPKQWTAESAGRDPVGNVYLDIGGSCRRNSPAGS